VNACKSLRLSENMQRSLTNYMTRFTRPLIHQVYGDADCHVQRFDDLVTLFRDPDPKKALAKLRQMADRLSIPLDYIPKFIEDYGDIFLALSYYHHCLDGLAPLLDIFHAGLKEMKTYSKVNSNPQLMAEIERPEKTVAGFMTVLRRMFQDFAVRSRDMWDDMSAAKFKHVKDVVEGAQTTVGGVLWGLTVKLNAWYQRFPSPSAGGPTAREEFLISEFKPGLSGIVAVARGQGEVIGLS